MTLAAVAAAFPQFAVAQQARMPRIAFVCIKGFLDIPYYLQGLADFGYVDVRTAVISSFLYPTPDEIPAMVAAAVASRPDIILLNSVAPALAAKAATSTIPIVFGLVRDPVGQGVVASLAHPGGNLTGASQLGDLVGR
jgi:putative ABC transport system substrate-binding protein